MSVLQRDNSLA